jgi:putative MATE family efflux protein
MSEHNKPEAGESAVKIDAASRLGTDKVGALLLRFSIPAITGMLVNALYNVVDRIFVGRGVNEVALGGLSLVMPLMTLSLAFAMLVGTGAANLISMRLGQQRRGDAENALNHCFRLLAIVGAVLMVLELVFLDPLLELLLAGATDGGGGVLEYARSYYRIILFGSIFLQVGFGFSHCTRAQGFPMVSMIGMILGAGLNLILDPIFIFGFHWGVEGAAWATIISQTVSAFYVLSFASSKKAIVRLRFRTFSFDNFNKRIILDIFSFGMAQFLLQLAMSTVQFLQNTLMIRYGAAGLGVENDGAVALSGMTIIGSVVMLVLMPVFGINQGAQPVLGYNYGAKKWARVFSAFTRASLAATAVTTCGFLIAQFFAPQLVSLFVPDGSEALRSFAPKAMRIGMLIFPLVGFQIVASNMFVVTGRPKVSIFLSMLRQVIILIPCILIFGKIWGLFGVVWAAPVSDAAALIVTATLAIREMKKLRHMAKETAERPATQN